MDPRAAKLVRKGIDSATAELLVKKGYGKPSLIRKARVRDLEDIKGLGRAKVAAVRKKMGAK